MPLTDVQSIALRKIVEKYGIYHHVNGNDSDYDLNVYQALIAHGYLEQGRTNSTLVAPKTEIEYNYYFTNGNFGSYGCLYASDAKKCMAMEESRANTPIYRWNPHARAGEPFHEAYLRASVRSEEWPILMDKWPVYVNRIMQLIRLSPDAHADDSDEDLLQTVSDDIISGRRAEKEVAAYFRGATMRGKFTEFDLTKHLNRDVLGYMTEEYIVTELGRRARMLQVNAVRFALDLARDGDYENTRNEFGLNHNLPWDPALAAERDNPHDREIDEARFVFNTLHHYVGGHWLTEYGSGPFRTPVEFGEDWCWYARHLQLTSGLGETLKESMDNSSFSEQAQNDRIALLSILSRAYNILPEAERLHVRRWHAVAESNSAMWDKTCGWVPPKPPVPEIARMTAVPTAHLARSASVGIGFRFGHMNGTQPAPGSSQGR